jgi:hypothetical protein
MKILHMLKGHWQIVIAATALIAIAGAVAIECRSTRTHAATTLPDKDGDLISIADAIVPPGTWGVIVSKSAILCDEPGHATAYDMTRLPQGCVFAGKSGLEVQLVKQVRDSETTFVCVRPHDYGNRCQWIQNTAVETKDQWHKDQLGD